MYQTDQYEGMISETVTMKGHNGDPILAYVARPLGAGPFPGMVVIHHAPGWDEWYRECTRRFAHHGYISISPNLYHRDGHGTPEDVGAKVRAAGGAPDARVLGDLEGAIAWLRGLPNLSGKVGIFGTCSGGRLAFFAGCKLKGLDAVAWRVSTATSWRRPVRSSHKSDTARPSAASAAALVSPMRNGVGRIGSGPPVISTPRARSSLQPGTAIIVRSASLVMIELLSASSLGVRSRESAESVPASMHKAP